MDSEPLTKEQLLLQIEQYQNKIADLKSQVNTLEKEKHIMQLELYDIKDICKTYFTSKTLSKEEFYTLYKRNVRGNLDLKL